MSLNVRALGEGPPVLLLHGFTGSARTWDDLIDAWSSGHRCIAPDLLGHGGSEAPVDPARYALERQAAELAELLRLLDAVPATLVGYSMGARLALVLALEHPAQVQRLILESPSAGIADGVARAERRVRDEALARDLEQGGLEAFVDRWEAQPLFASHASMPRGRRQRLRAERLRHDAAGLAASLRGAGQGAMRPLHDRLGHIDVPTLVIAGERDGMGRERASVVVAAIPGARLEVVPGAGHTPHLEDPEAFLRLADAFLRPADPMLHHLSH
jgi:2-succinyl-6-hydroxy-2,4-cyclohexadiene-1-carboxylate synthase